MKRAFTCVICPNGCDLEAVTENGTVTVTGNLCPKGQDYAVQELTDPRRTIATSVPVKGGELPLVSVRLNRPIPRDRIFDVMEAINAVTLEAPVHIGQIVIGDVLGLDSDVIVTKEVDAIPQ